MIGSQTVRHPPDAQLIALADDEIEGADAARLRDHLLGCQACAGRLAAFRRTTHQLDALLEASAVLLSPPPLPPDDVVLASRPRTDATSTPRPLPSPSRWLGRAAAAVLVLAGLGALAPPVRAWVVDRVQAVMAGVTEPSNPPPPDASMLVRLVPSGSRLLVDAERTAPGAVLDLRRIAEGGEVVLEVASPGAEIVVLPNGIRLEGGPGGALYRLSVPVSVEVVELRGTGSAGPLELEVPPEGSVRIPVHRTPPGSRLPRR